MWSDGPQVVFFNLKTIWVVGIPYSGYHRKSKRLHRKMYPIRSRRSTRIKELAEEDFNEEMLQREEDNYLFKEMTDMGMTELLMPLESKRKILLRYP